MARTLGDAKITRLLQANLRDEEAALRKVEAASKRLSNGRNGRGRASTERYLHAARTSYPDAAELAEERLFGAASSSDPG